MVTADITLAGGGAIGDRPSLVDNLIVEGNVSGIGSLILRNETEINGIINHRGHLVVTGDETVRINGPMALPGDVFFGNDGVHLRLGNLAGLQDRQFHLRGSSFFSNRLTSTANNAISDVSIDPRGIDIIGRDLNTRLEALPGTTLEVAGTLDFLGGTISGAITGQTVLVKKHNLLGQVFDAADADFERIEVEDGRLALGGDFGSTPPEVHVSPRGRLSLLEDASYSGDIYLNGGKLREDGDATLFIGNSDFTGNLFLSGGLTTVSPGAISGSIHGSGSFASHGGGDLEIRSSSHTYTGVTLVRSDSLVLVDDGALATTSKIIGFGRNSSSGGHGRLVLDNRGSIGSNDRIADHIPVELAGLEFKLIGREGESITETLGQVTASRGISELLIENPAGNGDTELVLTNFTREQGALFRFELINQGASVRLPAAPPLDDGIVGGWAILGDDFASYGPNGFVAYEDVAVYQTDINAATALENVQPNVDAVLTNDRVVNALRLGADRTIDLNGHSLRIETGGLLLTDDTFDNGLFNGKLTAGSGSSGELLVTGEGEIGANIIDNNEESVGLTYSSLDNSTLLLLSGINTYSGPTVVNAASNSAKIQVAQEGALPSAGDVILNGGSLELDYVSTTPLEIDELIIREGATVSGADSGAPSLRPQSIALESGSISIPLSGDAPLTKTGFLSGVVGSMGVASTYTGPILIEEGMLSIDQNAIGVNTPESPHKLEIMERGTLAFFSDYDFHHRRTVFHGGEVFSAGGGTFSAPLEVASEGGRFRNERGAFTIASAISGDGELVVEGNYGRNGSLAFEGDLNGFGGNLVLTGGEMSISGDNALYEQTIRIDATEVSARGTSPFGSGEVSVLRNGLLSVVDDLHANVLLNEGRLRLSHDSAFDGHLSIEGKSILEPAHIDETTISMPSEVHLMDGSQLTIIAAAATSDGPDAFNPDRPSIYNSNLHFDGDVDVSGESTVVAYDGKVTFNGRISPTTTEATLRLVGNDTFQFHSQIDVAEGQTLNIELDTLAEAIELSENASLTGNGILQGDFEISNMAAIAPGASIGLLTVDGNVEMKQGSQFIAELGGNNRGTQYDALNVLGDISLDEAVLNLSLYEDFIPSLADSFVLVTANYIEGVFANAIESVVVDGVELPITYTPKAVIVGSLPVPEPCTFCLGVIALATFSFIRRR